jgi:hypothetical protein
LHPSRNGERKASTQYEENVRQQILDGLIADQDGDEQISTATRILAEVIASAAAWLMAFNSRAEDPAHWLGSPCRRPLPILVSPKTDPYAQYVRQGWNFS